MVQKSKFEETVLESVPQLTIQLINTYLLGQINDIPPLTIFSICFSCCSLSNTIWFYGYWTLFRGIPIRDVPCTLALYNYKLVNVSDGDFSFSKSTKRLVKQSADVELTSVGDVDIDQEGSLLQIPEKDTLPSNAASPKGREMRSMSFVAAALEEKDAEIARLKQKKTLSADAASLEGREVRSISSSFVAKALDEKDAEIARLKQMLEKDAEIARLKQMMNQEHDKLVGHALPDDENV